MGREPLCQACEPADEDGQHADEQEHLQSWAVTGEAVFYALAVAMGFEVVKPEFDLHAARIEVRQLPRTQG